MSTAQYCLVKTVLQAQVTWQFFVIICGPPLAAYCIQRQDRQGTIINIIHSERQQLQENKTRVRCRRTRVSSVGWSWLVDCHY